MLVGIGGERSSTQESASVACGYFPQTSLLAALIIVLFPLLKRRALAASGACRSGVAVVFRCAAHRDVFVGVETRKEENKRPNISTVF